MQVNEPQKRKRRTASQEDGIHDRKGGATNKTKPYFIIIVNNIILLLPLKSLALGFFWVKSY